MGYTMIGALWIVWLGILYIMQIMLLNFLIAIISMSYDAAMVNTTAAEYEDKADMNIEAAVSKTEWNKMYGRQPTNRSAVFILFSKGAGEEDDDQ